MILIFCDNKDYNIKNVCEWLSFYKQEFYIYYKGQDKLKVDCISISENEFDFVISNQHGNKIQFSKIKSIWFRNGVIDLMNYFYLTDDNSSFSSLKYALNYYLSAHSFSLLEIILKSFKTHQRCLGFHKVGRFNKLIALVEAKKIGLIIPETRVITEKRDVVRFFSEYKYIINKSLDLNFEFFDLDNKMRFYQYTKKVTKSYIRKIPENFAPSVFQEYINKKFEIRVFYLNKKCYATAIFSQGDTLTAIDYRRYNYSSMNRLLPYKLSENLIKKIINLMTNLNLNTGALDFILNNQNEFVFLEVNPIGQYNYNSKNSGYNLDQKIAQFLIDEN